MSERIVIALGGNALGSNLPEQMIAVKQTAKAIADLIEQGHHNVPRLLYVAQYFELSSRQSMSAPMQFCSFSPNRKCRKMAGKSVQPLHNYTCRFRPSSLKQADKAGLDGLQTGKLDGG